MDTLLRVVPLQNPIASKRFKFFIIMKCQTKSSKNAPKRPEKKLKPCSVGLRNYHRHFFTVLHLPFQTQSQTFLKQNLQA